MRKWALQSGDPLSLVLAADARLSDTDYTDDQIWELKLGQGEATALSWQTTYGARARDMRLFLTLNVDGKDFVFARDYYSPPKVTGFAPALIEMVAQPLEKLSLESSFFAFDSHTLVGRIHIANPSVQVRQVRLGLAGILSPLDGVALRSDKKQGVHVLVGESSGLHPLVFATGGMQPLEGPYAGLQLDFELGPGAARTLTWVHVALPDEDQAFEQARRTAAAPLDALMARARLLQASDTVMIETGDPDWDAALAFSQTAALGKLFRGTRLPHLSLVASRRPEQGFSALPDGRGHDADWQGQMVWDAWYLMQALPGAPHLWREVLRNYLDVQEPDGGIDARPGLGGQRLGVLATPLLVQMAWQIYQHDQDVHFLEAILPQLKKFFWAWFSDQQDRDRNGVPEWTHALQSGYPDNPLFAPSGQCIAIDTVQSPALAAMLYGEAQALGQLADVLDDKMDWPIIQAQRDQLKDSIESCWHSEAHLYRYCDRDTHLNLPGAIISRRKARKRFALKRQFAAPRRLQIIISKARMDGVRPQVTLSGALQGEPVEEQLQPEDFCWQGTQAVATTRQVFDQIGNFVLAQVASDDQVEIRSVDLSAIDLTLFMPLCAGAVSEQKTRRMLDMRLLDAWDFQRPYGLAMRPDQPVVDLPWNAMIIDGLLRYGLREQAATLFVSLGQAVIRNLQTRQAFYARYQADSGDGLGGRHALSGVLPTDLFLRLLGVQFLDGYRVRISGENPFPWKVKLQYRSLTVERGFNETRVRWQDGEPVHIPSPQTRVISFRPR